MTRRAARVIERLVAEREASRDPGLMRCLPVLHRYARRARRLAEVGS